MEVINMTEIGAGEYDRNQAIEATLQTILGKAAKFRTQVTENKGFGDTSPSPEAGHRIATELFLDGVVVAQTLGKDQLSNLLNAIEMREADPDWAEGYRQKLDLLPQAVAEWQRAQRYSKTTRGKVVGALKRTLGADKGVNPVTGREK